MLFLNQIYYINFDMEIFRWKYDNINLVNSCYLNILPFPDSRNELSNNDEFFYYKPLSV